MGAAAPFLGHGPGELGQVDGVPEPETPLGSTLGCGSGWLGLYLPSMLVGNCLLFSERGEGHPSRASNALDVRALEYRK